MAAQDDLDRAALSAWFALGLIALVGVVGIACAVGVHSACYHTPPPVQTPDRGSARGVYCAAIAPAHPWLLLTVGPLLITLMAFTTTRRSELLATGAAVVVVVLEIANYTVANSLDYVFTI